MALLSRYFPKLLTTPVLVGGVWDKWHRPTRFPRARDLEAIPMAWWREMTVEEWDEVTEAYVKGCPVAAKIVQYATFYIRTQRLKLSTGNFMKHLGHPERALFFTGTHKWWRSEFRERSAVWERLTRGLFEGRTRDE